MGTLLNGYKPLMKQLKKVLNADEISTYMDVGAFFMHAFFL